MAEGGFKSYINGTVDQWMLTHNVEAQRLEDDRRLRRFWRV